MCKDCKYFKGTNQYTGYCKMWDDFVRTDDRCEEEEK